MRKEIIKTNDYLLLVDKNKDIAENMFTLKDGKIREVSYLGQDNGDAIIAHLPLNSPELEGVALLPEIIFEPIGFDEYKYTEDDIKKAIHFGVSWREYLLNGAKKVDEFFQSLQQSKYPIAFECKMVKTPSPIFYFRDVPYSSPKTITNSQGKTELVGTYIY